MAWINIIIGVGLPVIIYLGAMRELRSSSAPPKDAGLRVDDLAD